MIGMIRNGSERSRIPAVGSNRSPGRLRPKCQPRLTKEEKEKWLAQMFRTPAVKHDKFG